MYLEVNMANIHILKISEALGKRKYDFYCVFTDENMISDNVLKVH